MIDLNYRKPVKKEDDMKPETIILAVAVLLIWLPMAFILGGLL